MAYDESTVVLTPGETSGSAYVDIPFTASYIAIQNPSQATIYFTNGKVAPPLQNAQNISATKAFSGQIRPTQVVTVYWSCDTAMSDINNEVVLMFSDSPIQMTVSDNANVTNVNIQGTPTINLAAGTTVEIGGTATVQFAGTPTVQLEAGSSVNATIQGTPTFELAAGSEVQANITNAQLSAQVINTNSSPVPTVPQTSYGTGADGSFNPSAPTTFFNEPLSNGTDFFTSGSMTFSASGASAPSSSNTQGTAIQKNVPLSTTNPIVLTSTLTFGYSSGNYLAELYLAQNNNAAFRTAGQNAIGISLDDVNTGIQISVLKWSGTTSTTLDTILVNTPASGIQWNFKIIRDTDGTITISIIDGSGNVVYYWHGNDPLNLSTYYAGILMSQSTTTAPYWYMTNLFASNPYYTFNNAANQVEVKNWTSVLIPAGLIVRWANPAKYVVWFSQGDADIEGTIQGANAIANNGGNNQITVFGGRYTVPFGGKGGQGGTGYNNATAGGLGGAATAYASGAGGGGSAGAVNGYAPPNSPGVGTNGGTTSAGGTNASDNWDNGFSSLPNKGSTFILIVNGTVTINGVVDLSGGDGGKGGLAYSSTNNAQGYAGAGGGGSGSGGIGQNANSTQVNPGAYGGGGGGGAGGGVFWCYAAAAVTVNGTVNVNGGRGGPGGTGTNAMISGGYNYPGAAGQSGQAGTVTINQFNNTVGG